MIRFSEFVNGDIVVGLVGKKKWIFLYDAQDIHGVKCCLGVSELNEVSYIHIDSNICCKFRLADKNEVEFFRKSISKHIDRKLKNVDAARVPSNIDIAYVGSANLNDGIGLLFNNKKQLLLFDSMFNTWAVAPSEPFKTKGVRGVGYLVRTERKDLKSGDTAFYHYKGIADFTSKVQYCKIIDEKRHVYISADSHVVVESDCYPVWYKVVLSE